MAMGRARDKKQIIPLIQFGSLEIGVAVSKGDVSVAWPHRPVTSYKSRLLDETFVRWWDKPMMAAIIHYLGDDGKKLDVYLPPAKWYDWYTHKAVTDTGGKNITVDTPMDHLPVCSLESCFFN